MDFGKVFELVGKFFVSFCGINVTYFGITFTVGDMFLWCVVGAVVISFVRGLGS